MEEKKIKYLMYPTMNQKPHFLKNGIGNGYMLLNGFTYFSLLPEVTFQMGYGKNNEPIGMTILGNEGTDLKILELVEKFENFFNVRKFPNLIEKKDDEVIILNNCNLEITVIVIVFIILSILILVLLFLNIFQILLFFNFFFKSKKSVDKNLSFGLLKNQIN
jgi:hypothetical protein